MLEPIFVPQVEPRDRVGTWLATRQGADTNLPEWNWCGICCVRMIALGLSINVPSLESMYRVAFDQYGVFRLIDRQVVGAYHKELAEYVRAELGLRATALRRQSIDDLTNLIKSGHYFIASVTSQLRDLDGQPPTRQNGHLVLVYGVCNTPAGRVFVLHNSAGSQSAGTQSAVKVAEQRFAVCFSGNGVAVSSDLS